MPTEESYQMRIDAYSAAIAEFEWNRLKLQLVIAFNRIDAATNQMATHVHITKDNERVMDGYFKEMFKDVNWQDELGEEAINVYSAMERGSGAYRASGKSLFGRVIVWDANQLMASDGDAVPAAA